MKGGNGMKVVEIQCRCKDCIYYNSNGKEKGFCEYWTCEPYDTYVEVEEKDFCSNGERKR